MNKHNDNVTKSEVDAFGAGRHHHLEMRCNMEGAISILDPFQRWEHTELGYVQEEMRDHDRVLTENEYNDRARWGHD